MLLLPLLNCGRFMKYIVKFEAMLYPIDAYILMIMFVCFLNCNIIFSRKYPNAAMLILTANIY